jgi:hypothetical protein
LVLQLWAFGMGPLALGNSETLQLPPCFWGCNQLSPLYL